MIESLQLTFFSYLLATALLLGYFVRPERFFARGGVIVLFVGALAHLVVLVAASQKLGHLPVTNLSESLSLLSWVVVVVYLVSSSRQSLPGIGASVSLMASLLLLISFYLPKSATLEPQELRIFWFPLHILFSIGGDAFLLVASLGGLFYLLQERQVKWKHLGLLFKRLPSLEVLDELSYAGLAVGFVLLTLGILSGALWAEHAWGKFWSWEAKQTLSFVTWFAYGVVLQGRLFWGWRGRRSSLLSLLGLAALIFSFLGGFLFSSGSHNFF
ncbi:MAG: cytochrome c biogenesis protein CcsA [Deltaproteobacteria bacterium]|nr:cytochrome c biogenesis protein CcsA [Deltaproteobacteria bacterium]